MFDWVKDVGVMERIKLYNNIYIVTLNSLQFKNNVIEVEHK